MIIEKKQFVKDLVPGLQVTDTFVLLDAKQGQARNGPFWTLQLQDATGKIEAKIWSPQSQSYPSLDSGQLVRVEGMVTQFREQHQINVNQIAELGDLNQEGADASQFIPSSKEKPELLLLRLEELCRKHIFWPPWRKLVLKVLAAPDIRPRLLNATGGKAIHHAYVGGLLEHTLSVTELCLKYCEHYEELDQDVLLTAAVCHDLGKAWELTGGVSCDYTDEGRLLGHIHLGLEVLEPFLRKSGLEPELILHFKHIILSHHGEYEYGSPKRPKTAEAFCLHFADNMDAKMNQIHSLFGGDEEDGPEEDDSPAWSPYQRSLERYIYRPRHTPMGLMGRKSDKKQEESQCLLPLKG